jgi:hypothetical protein
MVSHEFDVPTISRMLDEKTFMFINMRRKDRKLVKLELKAFPYNNGSMNIWAFSEDQYGCKIIYTTSKIPQHSRIDRDLALAAFLKDVSEKINDYVECQYCNQPHKKDWNMCVECLEYGYTITRETCMICFESTHATKFKCHTCIDSIICLKCANNSQCKDTCPTCQQPQKWFGQGRKRKYSDSDSEED